MDDNSFFSVCVCPHLFPHHWHPRQLRTVTLRCKKSLLLATTGERDASDRVVVNSPLAASSTQSDILFICCCCCWPISIVAWQYHRHTDTVNERRGNNAEQKERNWDNGREELPGEHLTILLLVPITSHQALQKASASALLSIKVVMDWPTFSLQSNGGKHTNCHCLAMAVIRELYSRRKRRRSSPFAYNETRRWQFTTCKLFTTNARKRNTHLRKKASEFRSSMCVCVCVQWNMQLSPSIGK